MAAAADLVAGFFPLPPLLAVVEGPPVAADPLPPPCRDGEGPPATGRRSSRRCGLTGSGGRGHNGGSSSPFFASVGGGEQRWRQI
ncbi:hypothetical protein OsI_18719 [Oryza sativa Indica Group]|uniref:Uncharacterized protein n=1 Tax=Oryza sativa subsp. indica TaxID=39946 RepID=A2Y131_ORYSI|nr:hypothetical protein OsI_18719 [Oryza sativa Indica Group]